MEQGNAVQYMIQNRDKIMSAYRDAAGSPSKAWKLLLETLPEIGSVMSLNTFRPYVTVFVAMVAELEKAEQRQVEEPGKEEPVTQSEPKNIDGWTLSQAKDGYYRLHRKITGKVKSIYLGKDPDVDLARKKIRQKERALKAERRQAKASKIGKPVDRGLPEDLRTDLDTNDPRG